MKSCRCLYTTPPKSWQISMNALFVHFPNPFSLVVVFYALMIHSDFYIFNVPLMPSLFIQSPFNTIPVQLASDSRFISGLCSISSMLTSEIQNGCFSLASSVHLILVYICYRKHTINRTFNNLAQAFIHLFTRSSSSQR